MAGPQNAVMGGDYPTELPEKEVDQSQLQELQKAARFSKTAEWKELKEHFERRMKFYQQYLPDGTSSLDSKVSIEERGRNWIVSNTIIGEFKAVIDVYEGAAQVVKDAAAQRQGA